MDFEQLRIFMVLAEERTFLGAANRLATSRSRVRRKLDQLEVDAGTPLVHREPSGLVLTPAGETLVRRGRALLEDAQHLIDHVRDVGREPTGHLVLAVPNAPAPTGWEEACGAAQDRYPKLRLDFRAALRPNTLIPSHAEIALTFEDEIPGGCTSIDLGRVVMRLVASDAYLARFGPPTSVEGLASHRIAVWRHPDRPTDRLPLRSGQALAIDPIRTSDDPTLLQSAIARGQCMGYLPAFPELMDPAWKTLFTDEISGSVVRRLNAPNVLLDVPRVRGFLEIAGGLGAAPH